MFALRDAGAGDHGAVAFVLVLGAGSGSEVVGLARVGVNVVGIERDAKQFRALTERVVTEAAFPAAALRQLDEDEAQLHVFRLLAAQFTKLNPDVASHFTEMQVVSAETGDADRQERATAGEAVATDALCPVEQV